MRLITFISIFVLSFLTCIASKSPVCQKNDLSSLARRTPSDVQSDAITQAVGQARQPFAGPGAPEFGIFRTKYNGQDVILKTYFETTGESQVIRTEVDKWKTIGGLIAAGTHPTFQRRQYHLVLKNFVPKMSLPTLTNSLAKALEGLTRESNDIEVQDWVKHMKNNPQELIWRRSRSLNTWIATPIYFATKSPIDPAISGAAEQFAEGPGFLLARTTYRNIPVTLKTYFETADPKVIDAEWDKWWKIELLVATAVGLRFQDSSKNFYSMILGNFVPEMPRDAMEAAIKHALLERIQRKTDAVLQRYLAHGLANPQEFAWVEWHDRNRATHYQWTAIPIHFITGDDIDKAIKGVHEPFIKESDFSISRTSYKKRSVTLKTYTTIDLAKIRAYCEQWKSIRGLIGIAAGLAPDYTGKIKEIYMILNNDVPVELSLEDMHYAIRRTLAEGIKEEELMVHLANPQEYKWTYDKRIGWTAQPIKFYLEAIKHIGIHSY